MTEHSSLLRLLHSTLAVASLFALVAICAVAVAAQSGRRVRKSTPAATPTPERSPEVKKSAEEAKPRLTFIVGTESHGSFLNIPSYFFDSVMRACADRLDDAPSVVVEIAHRDMNRGEAVNRAKAEKEAFVVWLELRAESLNAGSRDLSDLYVAYWVFAPTTGKNKTSGRTYQQGHRVGPVITGPRTSGRTNSPYAEYLLKQAAREAAERILDAMKDHVPGEHLLG